MPTTNKPSSHCRTENLWSLRSPFCEKPFCPTSTEAEELIALANEHKVLLTIYQNRRYDTDFITLQKLIQNGSLGRVIEFETHVDRYTPVLPRSWKSEVFPGGGAVYDLGSHLFDQIVVLFGLPKQLTSFIGTQYTDKNNPNGFADYFTTYFHYDNGLTAIAKTNIVSPESRYLRFWVRGEKGTFKKYNLDIQESQLHFQGMKATNPNYAKEPEENFGTLDEVQADGSIMSKIVPAASDVSWRTFYSNFKKALDGSGPNSVPANTPAQVIRLIKLAIESSATGRTVIV